MVDFDEYSNSLDAVAESIDLNSHPVSRWYLHHALSELKPIEADMHGKIGELRTRLESAASADDAADARVTIDKCLAWIKHEESRLRFEAEVKWRYSLAISFLEVRDQIMENIHSRYDKAVH
jgi:hypothetical protein